MRTLLLYLYFVVSAILPDAVRAQVVTLDPPFPAQDDQVTVTFDASLGNGALAGETVVYAHTGVITNQSSSPIAWRHVQGNWGTDDSKVKMTSIGNNKFRLTYRISTFYAVPANEQVQKLAFVFRNRDGSKVGRNADGSDIFTVIGDGSFRLSLTTTPSGMPPILSLTETLSIGAGSSASASIGFYINDSLYASTLSDTTQLTFKVQAAALGYGRHKVVARAIRQPEVHSDSLYVIVRPGSATQTGTPPAGTRDGINYINDSTVTLQLLAPQKDYVYVIGDFNNWELLPAYEMTRTPDGLRYWITLTGLQAGIEYAYQYSIDKELLRVADPFADKMLDPYNDPYITAATYPNLKPYPAGKTTNYVSVFQTAQSPFSWQHTTFNKPAPGNLVIYELLVRDFVGTHHYQSLIDTLGYLERLGVNAIELMPFNEFEGNESWGYNTVFYFAPDKYYGTKNDLKRFIDECHRRGIAVIMDMVLNHSFGQSSMVRMYFDQATGKPANSPWFNADATHPFNVGYDFNHESVYTQNFVDTVLQYWLNEYHIDGYRFDLSKGFTQRNNPDNVTAWGLYDQSRINTWKRISDRFRPACSDCYLILEHFADNTEEKVLSDYGFMLWGNSNHAFNEATMGYASDLSWASYKQRGWGAPNLVSYMESHDEERLMFKNISYGSSSPGYNVKDTVTALSRNEAAAVLLASLPGPYMLWQFGELGYDYSIDFNGRLGNKPIRWDYRNVPARKRLYDVYAAMNKLRTSERAFTTNNFSHSLTQPFKIVKLNDTSMNVIAAANFGTSSYKGPLGIATASWWYDYFSGDSLMLAPGSDTVTLEAGGYLLLTSRRLATPPVTPVTALDEAELSGTNPMIYPNPARATVYISSGIQARSYTICDLSGRKITSGTLQRGQRSIDVSLLTSGCYLAHIITESNETFTRKIIIQ